jgi:hypothetical protein
LTFKGQKRDKEMQKTSESLKDYLTRFQWGKGGCYNSLKPMADFLGVGPRTIQRWWIGKSQPLGLVLVKLRYFLEKCGYEIQEFSHLDQVVYDLGRLIAFGQLNYEEISRQFGYTDHAELLQVLHGMHNFSDVKQRLAVEICATVKQKMQLNQIPIKQNESNSISSISENEALCLLRSIFEQTSVLLPRLEALVSDKVSPDQRRQFREKAGKSLPFDLANRFHRVLNALCSERARQLQE